MSVALLLAGPTWAVDDADPAVDGGSEPEREPQRASAAAPSGWLGLSLAQDFLLYGSEPAVCPSSAPDGTSDDGAAEYRCYAREGYVPEPVYGPAGNEISGGIGVATTRVLLGYDHRVGANLLLGVRAGYAFGGPPRDFLPLHAEVRGAWYFGAEPFTRQGLRPYVSGAVGLAQLAGRVPLQVYVDEAAYVDEHPVEVDAWRTAGNGFAALGFGLAARVGGGALSAELRALQLFGTSASALSLGLGYAYGL